MLISHQIECSKVEPKTASNANPSGQPVAGTTIFDGVEARKGYALNKMCFSFNNAENCRTFLADEATCTRRSAYRRLAAAQQLPHSHLQYGGSSAAARKRNMTLERPS